MTDKLDRRQFVAGTAASIALGGTLLACEDGQATPPAEPTPPTPAEPKAAEPAAQPKEEAKPEAPKAAEPVQEKKFPMNERGKLTQVTHPGATTNVTKVNDEVVATMVAEALKKFTGEADAVKAIGRFIKKDDVVGIKINTLGSPYSAVNPGTAFALAELCHKLGIPKGKIYIYDQYGSRMKKARFKPLREGSKDPSDDFPVHFHETMGYEAEKTEHGGKNKHNGEARGSQFPKLLAKLTAVINVCCPKDHDLTGVTGALKNVAYGNIERVPIFHCKPECNPVCVHDGICNVAQIYKHEQLGGKVRVIVCDALRVLYQGGPQDNSNRVANNAILVGTDPVAMDTAILKMVNDYRSEKGLKPVEQDRGGRRAPRFIASAAKLGLGEADLAKIKWDKHTMG